MLGPEDKEPTVWVNAAHAANPLISVCIPFFKFDVTLLLARLLAEAQQHKGLIEINLADDASGDAAHLERLQAIAAGAVTPVRISEFGANQGRACVRQFLTQQAEGGYVLFMDCDMYPDAEDFLGQYLQAARSGVEDIVIGGCSYARIDAIPPAQALYYYYSDRTHNVSLDARCEAPLRYIFTNNMMIRRTLLVTLGFDTGYVGWGYEDTDIAISAARAGAHIQHIENTATHFGLIDDEALIDKYRNSTGNYLRLIAKFPAETAKFPVFRAASALSRLPLPFALLSRLLEHGVRASLLPMQLRYLFLQSMKLSLYSQAMRRVDPIKIAPPLE